MTYLLALVWFGVVCFFAGMLFMGHLRDVAEDREWRSGQEGDE